MTKVCSADFEEECAHRQPAGTTDAVIALSCVKLPNDIHKFLAIGKDQDVLIGIAAGDTRIAGTHLGLGQATLSRRQGVACIPPRQRQERLEKVLDGNAVL